MLTVKNFRVLPWGQESIRLEWEMEWDTDNDPRPLSVIERSESPEGPFDGIAEPKLREEYIDQPIDLSKKLRTYYYRVVFVTPSGDRITKTEPEYIRTDPDPYALEIIRRNELLLERYISPDDPVSDGKVYIFPKQSQGERCPECWDEVKRRRSKNDCEACNGSGFINGGYLDPIETYVAFSSPNEQSNPTQMGQKEESQTVAWTSNYPIVKPQDIIVEPYKNERWRVVNTNPSEKGRYVLRQTMNLTEVDIDHAAWDLDVPGLKDQDLS